jgi:hypothetical protein
MGQIRLGQGPLFYPVVLLFRTTPLVLLTFPLSLFQFRKEKERSALFACWAYVFLFMAFTTVVAKKGDRYILPIFPVLDILGAIGLGALSERIMDGIAMIHPSSRLHEQALLVTIGGLILLFQIGSLRPHHPYYLSYYNPLLGGPPKAAEVLEIGLGEGLERAAQYLNGKENAEKLHVSTWYRAQFAPFFIGQTSDIDSPDVVDSDYFVFYVNQVQRRLEQAILSRYYDQVEPEHIVSVNGIDYAWIYHNVNYSAPLDYLHKHIRPMTDVVLVDRPSLLGKYYRGEAPLYALSDQMEEMELVRYLKRISVGRERIWYLSYPSFSDSCREMLNYQLATQAYKVESVPFPDIEVTLYQLPESPSFQVTSVDSLQPLTFGGQFRLRGYGISSDMTQWGRSLGVVLEWQVLCDIQKDYKVFLHLVDSQGHTLGQKDRPIRNNSLLPSSQWVKGEVVQDRYALPLLQPSPLGRRQLVVGLYESESGQRLPIMEEGQPIGDSCTLTAIDVVGSPIEFSWESLDIPHVLKKKLMTGVELLGYGADPESVVPGQDVTVSLYWQALHKMEEDYTLLVQLVGEEARVWSEGTFPLATERYPTSHWRPGEVVWGRYTLPVYDEAPWTTAVLCINLLDSNGKPVFEKDIVLGEINIKGKLFSVPNIQHPMQIRLGERIRFLGYALDATELRAGEKFSLILYWQAQDDIETSYTVFTHLLDENNHIWGQKDSVPCDGNYPTTRWVTGEVIVDEYEIPVNPGTPPGEYSIEVGMYEPETRERLAVFDEGGKRLESDRILLGKAEVEE